MTVRWSLSYEAIRSAHRASKGPCKRACGVCRGFFLGSILLPVECLRGYKLAFALHRRECVIPWARARAYESTLAPLDFKRDDSARLVSACEFVLEGLYAQNKIARNEEGGFEAVTKAKRDRRGMIYEDFTDIEGYN